jgi:DNA-binding transcriptional ArsR family regulator
MDLSNVRAVLIEDQRLVMLRFMASVGGYSANDSILDDVLAQFSHHISRDQVRTHMRWLEEQGLVVIEQLGKLTLNARITQRGIDVSKGEAFVDGVKRPSPGA